MNHALNSRFGGGFGLIRKGVFFNIKECGLNPTNIFELNTLRSKAKSDVRESAEAFFEYFKEAIEACQEQKLGAQASRLSFS